MVTAFACDISQYRLACFAEIGRDSSSRVRATLEPARFLVPGRAENLKNQLERELHRARPSHLVERI